VRAVSAPAMVEFKVGSPAPKYLFVSSLRTFRFLGHALRGGGVYFAKMSN
jgi:hypothetical protein